MQFLIKKTGDGFPTLYIPEMDEQYHSLNGAFNESVHVFIRSGYLFNAVSEPVVLEVGFGTGLNCLITADQAQKNKRPTTYYTLEKYPVEFSLAEALNYGSRISEEARQWFSVMHSCPWETMVQINPFFRLFKMQTDITSDLRMPQQAWDVVYFDAFAPAKQPEMWSPEIFARIYSGTRNQGIFVTYSAKGQVRRQLVEAGFSMERLPGPPGKKEMLRGIKIPSTP